MTERQVFAIVATVLTTIAEVGEPIPKSSIYLLLNSDIGYYGAIERILTAAGLVTVTSETMKLTAKGVEAAATIKAAVPGA